MSPTRTTTTSMTTTSRKRTKTKTTMMTTTSTRMTTRTRRITTSDPGRPETLEAKEARLRELLASYDSLIVAFSGGADSAYLAWAATDVLGQSALCITADSPSYPDRHRQLALTVAREAGLLHEIIHTSELDRAEYRANPTNRCYYCKHELYTALTGIASDRGIAIVADGSKIGRASCRERVEI